MASPILLNITIPLTAAIAYGGDRSGDDAIPYAALLEHDITGLERADLALLYVDGNLFSGDGTAAPLLCEGHAASGRAVDIARALEAHIRVHVPALRTLLARITTTPADFVKWQPTGWEEDTLSPRLVSQTGPYNVSDLPAALQASEHPTVVAAIKALSGEAERRNAAYLERVADWVENVATDEELRESRNEIPRTSPIAKHPKVIARLEDLRARR